MKDKKTLLDAMANIDDAFIEEAAHPEMILKAGRRAKRLRMLSSRRIGTLAACFVVAVGLMFAVPYLSKVGTMREEDTDKMSSDQFDQLEKQESALNAAIAAAEAERSAAEESRQESKRLAEESKKESERLAEASRKEESDRCAAESRKESDQSEVSVAQGSMSDFVTSQVESIEPSDSITYSTSLTPDAIELYSVNGVTYEFTDGIIYDAFADVEGVSVTDLVIPETLGGVTVEKLHTQFWSASETWKSVTIPATVTSLGDVSALSKDVVVYCDRYSVAYDYFHILGYNVQELQP